MRIREIRLYNLLRLIDEFGQQAVIHKGGVSQPYISQLKSKVVPKGRSKPRSMGDDVAARLEKAFHKQSGWMDRFDDVPVSELRKLPKDATGMGNTMPVLAGPKAVAYYPLISWVQAGNWQEVVDAYPLGQGEAMVPSTKEFGANTYCLKVRGDSMEPKVLEGSTIFVDPDCDALNGSLVVVRLDDDHEATFKRLVIEGGKRLLAPINPRYPVMEVEGPATICGVIRRIQPPLPEPVDLD